MPDVRLPDGTLVKNVPEGITQSELMRRLGKAAPAASPSGMTAAQLGLDPTIYGPNFRGAPSTQSVGPAGPTFQDQLTADISLPGARGTGDQDITRGAMAEVARNVAAGDQQIPLMQRESFHEQLKVPLAATAASLAVPGSGWGALALQSLAAGGGATAGELIRQQQTREPTDFAAAARTGVESGAGNFAVGGLLKTLGAASKAIFSTPLSEPQKAAAAFAREEGAPFPLSSAAPRTGAARTQQAARGLLPGEIRTQIDADRVTQFLNQRVSTIVDNASPVDEAALKGQQFLRKVFEPGETVYTDTFKGLRSTLGDDTAIPLTNTRQVIEGASDALQKRGEMKAVFNRLRNITKGGATEQTVQQLDELYSGLLKDVARNPNARPEANAVLSAIAEDIDVIGKDFGVSLTDDLAAARAVRDQFRELRNMPQLERLSKDFGDKGGTLGSRQWMTELFANPNGKALAELRTRNPELYHDLADSWLAGNINRFSKPVKDGFGRALDGKAFRSWFEQNEGNLKLILGGQQAKALDNFSLYAQHMAGAVDRSVSGGGRFADPMAMFARGGAEIAGLVNQPFILVPGEAASYVLAKGLSDPNSQLFKVFTEGFSQGTRSFVVKSGGLAGQAAGRSQSRD